MEISAFSLRVAAIAQSENCCSEGRALEILEDGIYYQGENSALTYRRVAYLYEAGKHKEAILELFIALTQDFDAHVQLLEYSEKAKNSTEILAVISSYKNQS